MRGRLVLMWMLVGGLMMPGLAHALDEQGETFRFAQVLMTQRKEYDLAAKKFAEFVNAAPRHELAPQALTHMAECYTQLEKFGAAAQAYTRLLNEYPDADPVLQRGAKLYGGHAYFRLERYADAAAMYGRVLENATPQGAPPEYDEALFWRAKAYDEQGAMLAEQGRTEEAKGEYRKAAQDFEALLNTRPQAKQTPLAQFSAGVVRYELGEYTAAAQHFRAYLNGEGELANAPDAQFYLGECFYQMKQYEAAYKEYEAALALRGRYQVDAQSGMAWCDYLSGRLVEAGAGFAKAAQLAGNDETRALQEKYHAGAAYHAAGKLMLAAEQLAGVVEATGHPAQAAALFELGTLKLEQAKAESEQNPDREREALQEAVRHLKAALSHTAIGDLGPEVATFLGEAYLDLEEYANAADAYNEIITRWPDDERMALALYHRALALRETGNIQDAKESLKTLFQTFDTHRLRLQAAYAMADYQAQLGKTEQSRKAYEWVARNAVLWARQVAPNDTGFIAKAEEMAVDSRFRLGESLFADQLYGDAREHYEEIVRLAAESRQAPMALLRLGEIAEKENQQDTALQQYQDTLRKGTLSETVTQHAAYRVAELLFAQAGGSANEQAKLNEARDTLNRLIQANPETEMLIRARYLRAEILYALQEKEAALADYRAAYDAAPEADLADARLFGLAWCYRDLGETAQATQSFEQLVSSHPESEYRPDALFVLGVMKFQTDDLEDSLAHMEMLIGEHPDSEEAVRARVEKGRILDGLGRHAESIRVLNAFIRAYPDHADVPRALHRLSWAWAAVAQKKRQAAEDAQTAYRAASGPEAEKLKTTWLELKDKAASDETSRATVLELIARNHPQFDLIDTVHFQLGEISYQRKNYTIALAHYDRAMRAAIARPQSEVVDKTMYRRGMCYLRLGEEAQQTADEDGADAAAMAAVTNRQDQALAAFAELIDRFGQSDLATEAHFRSAEIYRQREAFAKAFEHYDIAARQGGDAWYARAALYGVGLSQLETDQASTALDTFKAFLREYADGAYHADAEWGAGQAALMLGAYADAESHFQKVLVTDAESEAAAKARLGLGMIQYNQGNWEQAREAFLKVDTFHGQWHEPTATALLQSARAAKQLGEMERARNDFERLMKYYQHTSAARNADRLRSELGL